MFSLLLAAALQTVQPGELKQFDRWAVGCDNGRSCRAVSLLGDRDEKIPLLAIDRGPEPSARPILTLEGPDGRPCTSFAMFVDSRRLGQSLDLGCGPARAGALAAATDALVAATRVGDRLELMDAEGRVVAGYSLKGAAEALRHMDVEQKRAGSVTALVAAGPAPASAVPSPPLPVVREVRAGQARKGRPLSRYLADPWLRKHNCRRGNYPKPLPSYRLDRGRYLFLVHCHFGSGNRWPLVLTARQPDGRDARPALFDHDSSMNDAPGASAAPAGASWDPERGRLLSGWTGECGFSEEWVWDGSRFRLVEHLQMVSGTIDRFSANCRSDHSFWIPTWRASVVR